MNIFKKITVWALIFSILSTFVPYFEDPIEVQAQTSFGVQVVGTTNTQAVLSYTSPSSNACKIEVSESSSYSPLVHDVNPTLFSGADLDNRTGSINSGNTRIVVIGKRMAEKSTNGNVYSRALQTYTTHYYRVTCGSSVATGNFRTANIPLGMTYSDTPQTDPSVPGGNMLPTIGDEPIIDPYTGAYIKRITNQTPQPFLDWGGGTHKCGEEYIGPQGGILCAFSGDKGSYGHLYYIVPSTGEARHLGFLSSPAGFIVYPTLFADESDTMIFTAASKVYKGTYKGNYNAVDYKSPASMTWTVLIENVNDLMVEANPDFDKTKFGCSMGATRYMTYGHIRCLRGYQDSYAWWGVYDFSQNKVIATKFMMEDSRMRWCGDHWASMVVDTPWITFVPQVLKGPDTRAGHGPFQVSLTAPVNTSQTTISVSGEPSSIVEGVVTPAKVGDLFRFAVPGGGTEDMRITNKISATEWQVQRASSPKSFTAGSVGNATCELLTKGLQGYWNPFTDEFLAEGKLGFGHSDWAKNLRLVSGYKFVKGPIIESLLNNPEGVLDTVSFAGAIGLGYGNGLAKHPSYQQAIAPASEQDWFLDMLPFNGGNLYSERPIGLQQVSGQLYKYIFSSSYKQKLNRKQLPTLVNSGKYIFKDISGPNSVITNSSEHAYTYCVAHKSGECVANSQPGDAYMNIPGTLQNLFCGGGDGPSPQIVDGCMTDMPTYAQSITQFGMGANTLARPAGQNAYGAAYSRVLTKGLGGIENIPNIAKAISDGSWIFFNTFDQNSLFQYNNLMMLKTPPTPPLDGINRSTFIPANISITPPSGQGITNAVVYFGYNENSAPGNYYCTSRNESCVAVSSSVNEADPFKFAQTESYTGVPCTSNCSVTVPVLPMRVAYFQVKYLNSSGQVVANGNSGVIAERAVALSSGTVISPATPIPTTPTPTTPTPTTPTPPPVIDETPPTISAVTASNITSTGATVTWTTNEPATSQVQYGLTTAYGAISAKDQTLSLDHTMVFSNLTPGTTYNFRVISEDVYGNSRNSFNYTFTTSKPAATNTETAPSQTGGTTSSKFTEWSHKKTLTINRSQVSGSHTDFPVLVSFSDTDLKSVSSGGKVAKSDGGDIFFALDDDTKLAHEIENYNPSSGTVVAWVKVPSISSTADTNIKIYFGNSSASDQQNKTAVWEGSYRGVWHMDEDPSGSSPQLSDSTSNANSQTVSGSLVSSVGGVVSNAVHFPSTGQYNSKGAISGSAVDVGGQAVTVSAWVKYNSIYTTNANITGVGYGTYGQQAARLQFSGPSDSRFQFHIYQKDGGNKTAVGATTLSPGNWYHVVGTYNGANLIIYVNGVEDGAISTNINISSTADLFRTNYFNNTFSNVIIDEVRISKSTRSPEWIKTEYNSQNNPSSFVSVGGTEQNLVASKPVETAPSSPEVQTNQPPKVTPQNVGVVAPPYSSGGGGGGVLPKPPILSAQNLPNQTAVSTNTYGGSPVSLPRDLVFGAKGNDVITLQKTLISLGYLSADSATGYYGPLTLSAIKKYQQEKGIAGPGDRGWGNVGPQTRAHFANLSGTSLGGTVSSGGLTEIQRSAIQAQINSLLTLVTKLVQQLQILQGQGR